MKTLEIQSSTTIGNSVSYLAGQNGFREIQSVTDSVDQKIEQSIVFMMQHLDKPLHVSALASRANVSPSHYFALFKRRTGCAPIDFFIRLRMRRACRLLDATTMSVKEVAATLGYDDPFYFSRIFKSVNAVAPSDYRAMRRGASMEPAARQMEAAVM